MTTSSAEPTAATRASSDREAHCSELSANLPCTVLWEYDGDGAQIKNLYELAKEKTWNASKDVDWQDFSRIDHFPTLQDANPLNGFAEYDALSGGEKKRISWWQHGLEISEILHGEQGALLVASQLVACVPTVEAKLFASSQVFDEARHVEFFSRYLQDVVGAVYPPSAELKALVQTTLTDSRWDMKFIACQVLIESLAMAKFHEIKRTSNVPMLQFAISYIAKDEARHVNFGAEFLKQHLSTLEQKDIELRSEFVLDNVLRLANALNIYTRISEELGWNTTALRYHLRKFRLENPEINRNRFRQLILTLGAVGLLTDRTKERLDKMNLLV